MSAPAEPQRTQREGATSYKWLFLCPLVPKKPHLTSTDQVPTKFDELYSRVAALIKAFGRQQPKGTEVSDETRKKAKNAYRNKRFL